MAVPRPAVNLPVEAHSRIYLLARSSGYVLGGPAQPAPSRQIGSLKRQSGTGLVLPLAHKAPMKSWRMAVRIPTPQVPRRHLRSAVPTARLRGSALRENLATHTPGVPDDDAGGGAAGPRYGQRGYTGIESCPSRSASLGYPPGGGAEENLWDNVTTSAR